jgi:hypothetical protein
MGDRTYTQIEFTGEISEEQAEELVELLKAQGCETNSSANLLEGLKQGDNFYDGECNYAQMEEIEEWCGANDVGYLKSWMPGGDYGAGLALWLPGMGCAEECTSVEDSPVATLNELKKARDAGAVDDLIKRLEKFTSAGPSLKVLAVDDWTPELCVRMAKRALDNQDA